MTPCLLELVKAQNSRGCFCSNPPCPQCSKMKARVGLQVGQNNLVHMLKAEPTGMRLSGPHVCTLRTKDGVCFLSGTWGTLYKN